MSKLNIDWRIHLKRVVGLILLAALPALGLYLLLACVLLASYVHRELTVQRFAAPFFDYPLPPYTTEMSRSTRSGALGGAGHMCSYEAVRVVTSHLTVREIEAYYQDVTFPTVMPESSSMAAISGLEGRTPVFVDFDRDDSQSGVIEISIFDGPYYNYDMPLWDMLC